MKQRLYGIFAIIAALSLVLSACGGAAAPADAPAESAAAGAASTAEPGAEGTGERMYIELYNGGGIMQPTGEEAIIKNAIDEALGIDIDNVSGSIGDDYKNALNVRLAAGDAPDIFQIQTRNDLVDLAGKGILLELSAHLAELPNYVELAGPSIQKGYIGKELFALTNQMNLHPANTLFVRQDWLDKLELAMPTNLDELKNMLVAFTTQDPDGNGAADTYGIGAYGIIGEGASAGGFNDIFGAFGVPVPSHTFIKDGKVINSLEDPAMPDALAYLKELFDLGVISPESFSQTYMQCQQAGIQGKHGLMQMSFFDVRKSQYVEEMKAVDPNVNWMEVPAIEGPGGAFNTEQDIAGGGTMYGIPATLASEPERLAKVFELFEYLSAGEGLKLVQYGLEGPHHKRDAEGNVVEITDELLSIAGYFYTWQIGGRPEDTYLKIRWPDMLYDIDFNKNAPRIITYTSVITPPEGFNVIDADTFIKESLVGFVTGVTPISEYGSFMDTLRSTYNYQAYIDSTAEQLTELGFVS